MGRGRAARASSSSSSSCNNNNNVDHFNWSLNRDLTTDLRLGLSISASTDDDQPHNTTCLSVNPSSSRAEEEYQYYSSSSDQLGAAWMMKANDENELLEGNIYECDENRNNAEGGSGRMYVKVYMEGHPIGRKLNVLAHDSYQHLISTLDQMFNTNILWGSEVDETHSHIHNCDDFHVLTYEDEEGDWMMVGDVPWEMFLTTVRRLKITRACPC